MTQVVLGIDAGGTATIAQAAIAGSLAFEGRGGPGNAASTPVGELERHIEEATRFGPPPEVVTGCFAGMATDEARATVTDILRRRFPNAQLRLATDCAAALAASEAADVVVIAGTGSVVASTSATGIKSTGGFGHLIGDHGSGFRYGQLLLEYALSEGVGALGAEVVEAFLAEFGTLDVPSIVLEIHESPRPAARIARLCPLLAHRADAGDPWALDLVNAEAARFAATAAQHIDRHVDLPCVRIDLAGGAWSSRVIQTSFSRHLHWLMRARSLHVRRAERRPVEGAVALCRLPPREFRRFSRWPMVGSGE